MVNKPLTVTTCIGAETGKEHDQGGARGSCPTNALKGRLPQRQPPRRTTHSLPCFYGN